MYSNAVASRAERVVGHVSIDLLVYHQGTENGLQSIVELLVMN
jgi:hypothetical protein